MIILPFDITSFNVLKRLLIKVKLFINKQSSSPSLVTKHYNSSFSARYNNVFPTSLSPIPVALRSKAWVCGRSLAGIESSDPAQGMDIYLL